MEALGRPTPQPMASSRPRYRDRSEDLPRTDINPYLEDHARWAPTLLPAQEAWTWRGRWAENFGREAPLHLEIGAGNGFFLAGYAALRPDVNLVGLEIRYKRCVLCARKIHKAGVVGNARILRYHAAYLDDLFEPGSLAAVHVHHPDPWPKERHEKNRLISRWFLEDLTDLLQVGGELRLKTDHWPHVERLRALMRWDQAPALPLAEVNFSPDVNLAPLWPDDVETNYQRKFRERGAPVYALTVHRLAGEAPPRTTAMAEGSSEEEETLD